ncbi:MAG: hypothetical protein JXA09_08130 [Anaerolineae bacterium]|nr:hypothetical protein [Anaerolineae bacterium]
MYPNQRLDIELQRERAVRAQNRAAQAHALKARALLRPMRAVWIALVSFLLG